MDTPQYTDRQPSIVHVHILVKPQARAATIYTCSQRPGREGHPSTPPSLMGEVPICNAVDGIVTFSATISYTTILIRTL